MKHLSWLYILLILAGCTDMSIEGLSTHSDKEFYATIEGSDSRTYVDDQIRLRWTAEDCITIFKKTTYNREFMFTGTTGANAGGFKQKSVDDDFWYGADVPYNYAVYPHSSTTQLDETDHFFTLTMPSEQTYVENSFGLGVNTMVAASESGQLMFKNVGSYLRVRLYGKDIAVSSITLASKGNESIAGKAKVTPKLNGNPTCEILGTGKSIRLTCPEPVTISEDVDNPTDFWIVVPPVTLSKGFTVTVENEKGDTQVFEVTKPFTFERNLFTNMKREVSIASDSDTTPYVTFKADAEQTLTMSKAVETLEYSVGGDDWKELGTNTVTFGGTNGNLRLRGKSSTGTAEDYYGDNYSNIQFGNNTLVTCYGDIRTLVDHENYGTTNTENARFRNLFKNCQILLSAPELPAVTLANCCYENMFLGCTNLMTAPELPARTLINSCYSGMFSNCTSLTKAPELPATILKYSCYASMFIGCTNLKTAPELPAKTLDINCYANMFSNCTSLTKAPELPASTLKNSCYSGMFSNCTSLIMSPELPATTLDSNCYASMFRGCTNLKTAPELPAKTLTYKCYEYMFKGCTNITIMPELPSRTLGEYCYWGMFEDCTNLTTICDLPATTLINSCYTSMFKGCTNLKAAPKLPATTLAQQCYSNMFQGCTKLEMAPELPATTLTKSCYSNMFNRCSSLTTTPKLPATKLAQYCYSSMFKDCTKLTMTSELPATYISNYSYQDMFNGCTSLNTAPRLPGTSLGEGCYRNMFSNCTNLINAPTELPAMGIPEYCYTGMFVNCINLTTAPILPATNVLYESSYSAMFRNCSKLNSITMLATNVRFSIFFSEWVTGVSSGGTFVKAESMTSLPIGTNGVPEGWTVINYEDTFYDDGPPPMEEEGGNI